jgi:hypothetical protein
LQNPEVTSAPGYPSVNLQNLPVLQVAQECDDYILGKMAKQLKLTRRQFDDLIDCTMTAESYLDMLRGYGEI